MRILRKYSKKCILKNKKVGDKRSTACQKPHIRGRGKVQAIDASPQEQKSARPRACQSNDQEHGQTGNSF